MGTIQRACVADMRNRCSREIAGRIRCLETEEREGVKSKGRGTADMRTCEDTNQYRVFLPLDG